jgi:glycosyltransferase involved in cell wall biosynthesis
MRILVAAIGPLSGSGYATRITSMIQAYSSAGWAVDVLHARQEGESPPGDETMASLHDYVPLVLRPARPRDHLSTLPPPARLVRACLPAPLGSRSYDVAQAESSAVWPALAGLAVRARILVLHDDDVSRYLRIARQVRDPRRKAVRLAAALKYRRFQAAAIREADQVWCVSEEEQRRLGRPGGNFRYVPNGAAAGFFDVAAGTGGGDRIVTFVGPAAYDANRRAVAHFTGRIWPRVRGLVPDAELRLVGKGWDEVARVTDGAADVGWVDDLPAEVGRASVAVAPLLDGGGTKIKVVEAMAAARPVVATPVGAEGIPASSGLRVAADAETFARDVAAFLSDDRLAREAGEANRAAVAGLEWPEIWRRAMAELELLAGGVRPSEPSC